MADGRFFTVKDMVKYEANIKGGVHIDTPKSDTDRSLEAIGKFIRADNGRVSLRQLKAITRAIIRGLDPLRSKVEKSRS